MVLRVLRALRMFALLSEVSNQLSSDQKSVEENVVTFKHFFFPSESPMSPTKKSSFSL